MVVMHFHAVFGTTASGVTGHTIVRRTQYLSIQGYEVYMTIRNALTSVSEIAVE